MQFFLFVVLGVCVGWIIQGVIARRAIGRREADMTRELQARYDAYIELEGRISRAIEQFDSHERELTQTLAVQTANIERLRNALNQHEGLPVNTAPAMVWPDEPPPILPSQAPSPEHASSMPDISEWERKLEAVQEEKRTEIERQSSVIADLTRRLEGLAPLPGILGEREAEIENWKRAHGELDGKQKSEFDGMRSRIAELEPMVHRLAEAEEKVRVWEDWCHTLEQDKVEEIASLRTRVDELAAADVKLGEREAELRTLRQRHAELEESSRSQAALHVQRIANLESAASEVEVLRQDAKELRAKLDERRREIVSLREELGRGEAQIVRDTLEMDSMREELRLKIEALASSTQSQSEAAERSSSEIRALEQAIGSLQGDLETRDRTCATYKRQLEELDARMRQQTDAMASATRAQAEEAERRMSEISELKRSIEILQGELASRDHACKSYEAQIKDLDERMRAEEARVRERESEIERHQSRIQEIEADLAMAESTLAQERERIAVLNGVIQQSEREIKNHRAALAAQDSAFEAAKDMLADLVPMVEGLQSQLEKREIAPIS